MWDLKGFFKSSLTPDAPTHKAGWHIEVLINGVLKCTHKNSQTKYFEKDKLEGKGAFKEQKAYTAKKFFEELLNLTPESVGASFSDHYLVTTQDDSGLLLRKESRKETKRDQYYSWPSLDEILIEDFLTEIKQQSSGN